MANDFTDPNIYNPGIAPGTHLVFSNGQGQSIDLYATQGSRAALYPNGTTYQTITPGYNYDGQTLVGYTYSSTAHNEDFMGRVITNAIIVETQSGTYTYRRTVTNTYYGNSQGVGNPLFGIFLPFSNTLVFAGDARSVLTYPDGYAASNSTGFFQITNVQATKITLANSWSGGTSGEAAQPEFFMMATSPQLVPQPPNGTLSTSSTLVKTSPLGVALLNWAIW